MLDIFKKAIFYGGKVDYENLKEECGDVLWYLAIIFDANGWSFELIQEMVIAKLKVRYPHKFTKEDAFERCIEKEMEAANRKQWEYKEPLE